MSLLGFIAASKQWDLNNAELVGLEAILRLLPVWAVIPFTYMLISGLASTPDSNLCAISSLAGHDFLVTKSQTDHLAQDRVVRISRWSMVGLATAALVIANIPGMKILYLFLFYGTLRACTFLPTVFALWTENIQEPGMFWGILIAFVIGLPVFAFGNFLHYPIIALAGSLLTVLSSGGIVLLNSKVESNTTISLS